MSFFSEKIKELPRANVPIKGAEIYISQAEKHQVVFMQFEEDVFVPEHEHSDQVEFVIRGTVDVIIDKKKKTYTTGEQFYIPAGTIHSARAYAGYVSIALFDESSRYFPVTENST